MRSVALLVVLSIMSVLGCGGKESTGPDIASVVVTPATATLVSLGETVQLTASARNASGDAISGRTFTWSSSDESIATISVSGLVRAVANGSVTMTATTEGAEGTAAIEVAQAAAQLAFTVQPTESLVRLQIRPGVQVAIEDALGNPVRGARGSVTVALGANPSGATLQGMTIETAPDGIARFNGIAVDRAGVGYTLVASSPSLPDATSAAFDVITLLLASVNAGHGHTCGITTGATTYCWGNNSAGQLGGGSTKNRSRVPLTVSGGLTFASLSAGGIHTCAVTTSGTGYCWGFGAQGQLGGVAPDGCGSLLERCSRTPLAVSGNISFTSISAGRLHTCAVTTSSTAYCWGQNFRGALGDGTTTERRTPVLVLGGLTFQAVSAGDSYTCGIAIDGGAYCWGNNGDGQLGDGSLTDRSIPALVTGGLVWRTVSAVHHTCGITVDGNAYCWGNNGQGQLGNGSTGDSDAPTLVSGGLLFTSLSVGGGRSQSGILTHFTCGVTTGGSAYCWGFGAALGSGRTNNSTVPVAVSGGLTFESVTTGRAHACGVTTDHALYCWGANEDGQVGDGSSSFRTTPVSIGG